MEEPEIVVSIAACGPISQLTNDELARPNVAVQLGDDARGLPGYEKVSALFTEAGGARVHELVADVFADATIQRLSTRRKEDC